MTFDSLTLFFEPRAELLEAEQAAAACLAECMRARGLSQPPLPIPVEKWVENPLGFDYQFRPLADQVPGEITTLGLCRVGQRSILINEMIEGDEARVRWTTAHEIGHELLHAKPTYPRKPLNFDDPAVRYSNVWERQADRFAAALLMPPQMLVRALFDICARHHLSSEHMVTELVSRSRCAADLWLYPFLPELAQTFGLKLPAVFYRLTDLRLFDDRPLILPEHALRCGLLKSS